MKTRTFMTFAIAAALLTACDKNNEADNYNNEIRLRSGIEVETRAFTPTQSTTIANGEKVSVWVDDAKTPNASVTTENLYKANLFTADGSNNLTPTSDGLMYFPQTGNKVNIFALHGNFTTPFIMGNDFPSVSGAEYSVKNDQTRTTDYTGSDLLYAYSPRVARARGAVPLTFYHMLSKIEVAIKAGVGAPRLSSSGAVKLNEVALNGKFTPGIPADMSVQADRAKMLGDAATPSAGNMTLGQVISTDFNDGITYNEAVVVPQSMAGKTLTFKLGDGGTLTYTFPVGLTFESGKKYRYQITLTLTELSVTSEIIDWKAVATVTGDAVM